MKAAPAAFLLLLLAAPVFARIGETLPQLEARFGKGDRQRPQAVALGEVYMFQDGSNVITAWFIGNTCQQIAYNLRRTMKPEETTLLLRANLPASAAWVKDQGPNWHSDDRRLKATCTLTSLTIFTVTWEKAYTEALARFRNRPKADAPNPNIRKY